MIDILFCILFYILNYILYILYNKHIVHVELIYLHIAWVRPWLCPRAIHIMHIYWHILHIGSMVYCAYSAYLLTYCFNNLHIMHIMHIVFILVIFYIFSLFCVQDSFQLFIPIIAWPPIQGPSCSLTTTYIHHHCSGFCHKKLQESLLILFECIRVSSLSHPIETVSDAVNKNVSHIDSEKPSALCFKNRVFNGDSFQVWQKLLWTRRGCCWHRINCVCGWAASAASYPEVQPRSK